MDVKTSLAILKNENSDEHLGWADSCKKLSDRISYEIIDITKSDWLTVIQEKSYDLLLARPSGSIGFLKEMYDERLYCITKTMGYKIYPGFEECKVYENKRALAYMLKALKLKHPATHLFYHKAEAIDFSDICNFPIVGKTAIGAGGSGVRILKTKPELLSYVNQAFGSGLTRSWGPNMRKGNTFNRIKKRLGNIPETIRYFNKKKKGSTVDPQRGYVLLQEYIPCDHEWRCVVVGDSYFGHKKLRTRGEMMSGTSAVSWDVPSEKLLDFVKDVMQKTGFYSQAVDVFESKDGEFYINELQAFWGSKNPHQMLRNGIPGRYVKINDKWIFEEGEFNTNNSYDLRLKHALSLFHGNRL